MANVLKRAGLALCLVGLALQPVFALDVTTRYTATPSQAANPLSTKGVVTTPHYLASQSGLDVLRNGGNAVDAAIAAAATLAVVYPQMCTIGGDSFWLIYNAETKELKALNASGRAGEKATIAFYTQKNLEKIPARGYLAANTVPGIVSGWDAAYEYSRTALHSSATWPSLLASAIDYAEQGFPVSTSLAHWSRVNIDPTDKEFRDLQRFEGFRTTYLKPDGQPYGVGDVMKLPDLANTLKTLSVEGGKTF